MNVLSGREEPGLTLKESVTCTVVDTKHDNGWSRVFVISAINFWRVCSRLLDSIVSLASDGAWLYELLGYIILSALFCADSILSVYVLARQLSLIVWQRKVSLMP